MKEKRRKESSSSTTQEGPKTCQPGERGVQAQLSPFAGSKHTETHKQTINNVLDGIKYLLHVTTVGAGGANGLTACLIIEPSDGIGRLG